MHKKMTMFEILLITVLSLQGCDTNKSVDNVDALKQNETTGEIESSDIDQTSSENKEELSLKLLTHDNPLTTVSASSSEGAYTSRTDFSGENTQLMYIDFATCTEIPLSNNLSGVYGSDEDTSWFENTINISPYLINDKLYVFSNTDKTDRYEIELYSMDVDGKNRKKVYTWGADSMMLSGMAVSDHVLYLNISYYDDNGDEHSSIESLDLNTGERQEVYEQKNDDDMGTTIVGAYQNYLLIYNSKPGEITENGSEEDIYLNSRYNLWRFNVQTKESMPILEWGFCETTYCTESNQLYYIDQEKHAVIKMNWIDGSEDVLMTDESLIDGRRLTSNSDVYEGHWYVFDGEDLYIFDLDHMKINQMLLKSKGTNANGFMKILGISDDQYMVCISDEIDESTGGMNYIYAMINKHDFWNNSEAYQEIQLFSE